MANPCGVRSPSRRQAASVVDRDRARCAGSISLVLYRVELSSSNSFHKSPLLARSFGLTRGPANASIPLAVRPSPAVACAADRAPPRARPRRPRRMFRVAFPVQDGLVSRRYRQSPVFYDPTPARWPWVLALLVGLAAVVAGAILPPRSRSRGTAERHPGSRGGAPAPEPAANPAQAGTAAPNADAGEAPAAANAPARRRTCPISPPTRWRRSGWRAGTRATTPACTSSPPARCAAPCRWRSSWGATRGSRIAPSSARSRPR